MRTPENNYIDFDQVLREVQEENARRLGEILDEPLPSIPFESERVGDTGKVRFPNILNIFIPPGVR